MDPAETFDDVVTLMEDEGGEFTTPQNLDIRKMYWSGDKTPFRVKISGEDRLRRVLSVGRVDGRILVEIE